MITMAQETRMLTTGTTATTARLDRSFTRNGSNIWIAAKLIRKLH